jgi:hypothetical protein
VVITRRKKLGEDAMMCREYVDAVPTFENVPPVTSGSYCHW